MGLRRLFRRVRDRSARRKDQAGKADPLSQILRAIDTLQAKEAERADFLFGQSQTRIGGLEKRVSELSKALEAQERRAVERADFLYTHNDKRLEAQEKRIAEVLSSRDQRAAERADFLVNQSFTRFAAIEKRLGDLRAAYERPGGFGKIEGLDVLLEARDRSRPEVPGFETGRARLPRIPKLKDVMNDYAGTIPEEGPFRMWGFDIEFMDRKSLWIQLNELIFREEYYFSDDRAARHRIIDGGSNVGLSILYLKALYPNAEVIGFEPMEAAHAVALRNIERNGLTDVTLHKAAVGTENGVSRLFIDEADSMGASLEPRHVTEVLDAGSVDVEVMALADLLEEPVDFLKLDIEGSEAAVLKSVGDRIRNAECVFCEYHFGEGNESNSLRDIIDIFDDNGFDYQIAKSVWYGDQSEFRPLMHVGEDYSGVIYARRRGE